VRVDFALSGAMTVATAIAAIAAVVDGVSGVTLAPTYPRETMNESPFAVTYVITGEIDIGPIGTRKSLLNIAVDFLIPRRDIALDMETLTPFLDSIPAALLGELSTGGDIFSGTISTFEFLSIEFIPDVVYGGVQHIGYRFLLNNVKLLISL
jgi:uncharacterized membrane protein